MNEGRCDVISLRAIQAPFMLTSPEGPEIALRFQMIGQFRVWTNDGREVTPVGRKTRALLALLVFAAPETLLRRNLAGLLWSGRPKEQASASLRQEIHRLVDRLSDFGPSVLEVNRDRIGISRSRITTDTDPMLKGAPLIGIPDGELLEDLYDIDQCFDSWLADQRISLDTYRRESGSLESQIEQRPAAFQFTVTDGKLDALPESPDVFNNKFAGELYSELLDKATNVSVRLLRSNADPYVQRAIQRLVEALGKDFQEIRQGVLLSRSRTLDAIREAYDTEEARKELSPDLLAAIGDTSETLRDLLAMLPDVRKIEAERLAFEIQSSPYAVEAIQHLDTAFNKVVAASSEVMTPGAISATLVNDAEIREARRTDVKAKLLADAWLVKRNLVSAALGVVRYGGHLARIARPNFESGVQDVARVAPMVGLATFLTLVAGPLGGVAALSGGFRPVLDAITQLRRGGKIPLQ